MAIKITYILLFNTNKNITILLEYRYGHKLYFYTTLETCFITSLCAVPHFQEPTTPHELKYETLFTILHSLYYLANGNIYNYCVVLTQ